MARCDLVSVMFNRLMVLSAERACDCAAGRLGGQRDGLGDRRVRDKWSGLALAELGYFVTATT